MGTTTSLGERIKLVRGEMSRDKFAPLTGVSKNSLVFYEKGEREPGANYLLDIIKLFPNINPLWLLTGEGKMEVAYEALDALGAIFDEKKEGNFPYPCVGTNFFSFIPFFLPDANHHIQRSRMAVKRLP